MTDATSNSTPPAPFLFSRGHLSRKNLMERAVELEMPAMALLDRNGVYGSARFHTAAKRNNIRAHVGAEIAVSSLGSRLTPPVWLPHQYSGACTMPLLCESRDGYQNLCQLITSSRCGREEKRRGGESRRFAAIFLGLVCLTGGDEGPLAAALVEVAKKRGAGPSKSLCGYSDREMSTSSCSDTMSARKSGGIKPRFASRVPSGYRCWLPMAYATPPMTAKSSTSSPPFGITLISIMPGGSFDEQPTSSSFRQGDDCAL